ncbi:MAG: hypothetical protein ACRD1B_11360 [Thermoanaerobaculia bacterium]
MMARPSLMGASMNNATAERTVSSSPGVSLEIEPEVVMPSQFYGKGGIDASLQPEKRLMLAVLEDAVGTFQKYVWARDRIGQKLLAEVEEWFASEDLDWPYSFINVCNALDLEADFLRDGLRRWKQQRQDAYVDGVKVVRFPFRRVNGSRHAVTGRAPGLRHIA